MTVYRITFEQWSHKLVASGLPARWCSDGRFVIYTASSRALACLENVVHRSNEGLTRYIYKVMLIEIPADLFMESIELANLPENWSEFSSYSICQQIGNAWLDRLSSAVLIVPSVIIFQEKIFLLNPKHPDFQHIKLVSVEDFIFDSRIKL